jgi:hypothetical protein
MEFRIVQEYFLRVNHFTLDLPINSTGLFRFYNLLPIFEEFVKKSDKK